MSYESWRGNHEMATATLPMPKVPMGFRRAEGELPQMPLIASDKRLLTASVFRQILMKPRFSSGMHQMQRVAIANIIKLTQPILATKAIDAGKLALVVGYKNMTERKRLGSNE